MNWFTGTVFVIALTVGYNLYDTFDPDVIRGKRVLITGGSAGIGEQMAYHYAKLGAKVLITARTESNLQKVVGRCRQEGSPHGEYHYIAADMGDLRSYQKVIQAAEEKLGGLDFLVLNHLYTADLGEWNGSPENFTLLQKTLDINLRAYVHLASHALPLLRASGGSIVVVSSVAGKLANPYTISYSASKFALNGFFSGLRQEFKMRQEDISITICTIGLIGTENAVDKLHKFGVQSMLKWLPVADPGDCALAIVRGAALRQRDVFFPYLEARGVTLLRDWFPDIFEGITRGLFTRELT